MLRCTLKADAKEEVERKAEAAADHAKSRGEVTDNGSGSDDGQDNAGKDGNTGERQRKGSKGITEVENVGKSGTSSAGRRQVTRREHGACLLYTSPSPRD